PRLRRRPRPRRLPGGTGPRLADDDRPAHHYCPAAGGMSATGGATQRAMLDRVRRAVAAAPGATAVAGEVAHHAVQALTWRTLLAAEATARAQIAGAGPLLQPLLDHPDTTDVL